MAEITETQKRIKEEYEARIRSETEERALAEKNQKIVAQEIDILIKFLISNGLKRKKVIFQASPRQDEKTFAQEYFTGDEIHFQILSHAKEILPIIKVSRTLFEFGNLTKIEQSINLCLLMCQVGRMVKVVPHPMIYPDPKSQAAQTPKQVVMSPQQIVGAEGKYMFINDSTSWKHYIYLFLVLAIIMFFLLFKVWPDWLRVAVYYITWYLLVFLIGTAIVRYIVWFALFHVGIDFWIFPNYFIDSDNILDSFRPMLDVEKRQDMFDFRMLLVRLASIYAIFFGASEFLKEPENLDQFIEGSSEVWNELFEWGQNKFLGIPDNSTFVQVKKSARQIYAEAFMEDESKIGMTNRRYYDDTDYSVDPNQKNQEEPITQVSVDLYEKEEIDVLDQLTSNEL